MGDTQIRLGDLLTRAGLLKPEDLREGMLIAKQQSLPVGRVLIMAEFISEPNLQAAVQAQSMLKDGIIDIDTALEALKNSNEKNISLDDALSGLGWKDKSNQSTNKLGELLIECGMVTQQQLDAGLLQCQNSGLPLGRVLVSMGSMSEQLLSAALNAQILIRDSKIGRDQAIAGLKACRERQITIEQSLTESGLQLPTLESVRLGELLVMANLLDQDKLMSAVELGLVEEKPIGQVLVELGCVTDPLLQAALTVQRMVAEGKVKKAVAGKVVSIVAQEGLSVEQAVKKAEPPPEPPPQALPLYQFLQLSGIITAKDIEEALKQGSRSTELMGKMLMLTGAINPEILECSIRLNDMVSQGILKAEQAILAMGLCQNRGCSVEQAFKSLGWSMSFTDSGTAHAAITQVKTDTTGSGQFQSLQTAPVATPAAPSPQPAQQYSTGQHPAVQSQMTGDQAQYATGDLYTTGQHQPVPPQVTNEQFSTGQHQPIPSQVTNEQFSTGQHQAVQSQITNDQYSTASGQYRAISQTGDVVPITSPTLTEGVGDNDVTTPVDMTATSDVAPIVAQDMKLQPSAQEVLEEQDEDDDGGGGKDKRKSRKRLADLMP